MRDVLKIVIEKFDKNLMLEKMRRKRRRKKKKTTMKTIVMKNMTRTRMTPGKRKNEPAATIRHPRLRLQQAAAIIVTHHPLSRSFPPWMLVLGLAVTYFY
jgi:hypothetical protein